MALLNLINQIPLKILPWVNPIKVETPSMRMIMLLIPKVNLICRINKSTIINLTLITFMAIAAIMPKTAVIMFKIAIIFIIWTTAPITTLMTFKILTHLIIIMVFPRMQIEPAYQIIPHSSINKEKTSKKLIEMEEALSKLNSTKQILKDATSKNKVQKAIREPTLISIMSSMIKSSIQLQTVRP